MVQNPCFRLDRCVWLTCTRAPNRWWEKNLPDPSDSAPKLSTLRRLTKRAKESSIPCVMRGKVWLHASGGAHYRLKHPTACVGPAPPASLSSPFFSFSLVSLPVFPRLLTRTAFPRCSYEKTCSVLAREGESSASYRKSDPVAPLCLNEDGCAKTERVLACLTYTHPEIRDYCPLLPLIIRACLHWLDERDAYAVGASLIREPSPLLSTRVSSWLMLDVRNQFRSKSCSLPPLFAFYGRLLHHVRLVVFSVCLPLLFFGKSRFAVRCLPDLGRTRAGRRSTLLPATSCQRRTPRSAITLV